MAKKEKDKKAKFGEIAQKWLESKKGEVKVSSYSSYSIALKEIILPKISEKKMKTVCKQEFLEKLAKEFLDEGYRKNTVGNYITLVKSIVRYYQGTIEGIDVCKDKVEVTSLTEARKIIAKAKLDEDHTNFRNLGILIIMYTGMSISELCALKWENIDYEGAFISIKEIASRIITNIDEKKTQVVVTDAHAQRKVPIHSMLARAMKPYLNGRVEDDCYILTNSTKIMEPRTFQNYLISFCKGFDRTYTASNMREMFIVTALKKGMSPVVVAEIVGTTYKQIYDKYGDFIEITDDDKVRELKKLSYAK